jgi:hypothetical protein
VNQKPLREIPLRVRLKGPGVPEGRILLSDLVRFGRQLQTAVDRVALVLSGHAVSARRGRRPDHVRTACALEVVALEAGSFELALDFRRDQPMFPGMDGGEDVLEKLISGIELVVTDRDELPVGYDSGVLNAWRDVGVVFGHGVEAIDFRLRTSRASLETTYGPDHHRRVVARIHGPLLNRRSVEGRLLMADFKETRFKCRVHPSVGVPVECVFDESMEELVYENLRSFVRVTGEGEVDPETQGLRRLKIADIEPLEVESKAGSFSAEEFWREPTVEEVAAEQGVTIPQDLELGLGEAADLWEDDADFEAFVAGIYQRREGRDDEERRR